MSATMSVIVCSNCGAKNRVSERGNQYQAVCGRCRTPLLSSGGETSTTPLTLTDSTYETVLKQSRSNPVLVDAWAPWCGPCRMIAPSIDALAAEAAGRYVVTKLNVDENPRVATQHKISSIPTLLICKSGKLVDRLVGLHTKADIAARLLAQTE